MDVGGMNTANNSLASVFPSSSRPNYNNYAMTKHDIYVGQKAEEVSNVYKFLKKLSNK